METNAAAKMQPPARTFRIGRVLSQTFSIIRKQFGIFIGIALVPCAVSAVIYLFAYSSMIARLPAMQNGDFEAVLSLFSWWDVIASIVPFILMIVTQGAFSHAVFQQLTNRPVILEQSLAKGLKRFPYLFVTAIASVFLVFLGYVLLVIPGIIVLCFICVAIPVCVVEQKGPFASIGRSFRLTYGNWLRIFGLGIVACFIIWAGGMIIGMMLSLPMEIMLNTALSGGGISAGLAIAMVVWNLIVGLIMATFGNVLIAVIYFELRSSKEGVALKNLADVFA